MRVNEGDILMFGQMYERITGKGFSELWDVMSGKQSFDDVLKMNFRMLDNELHEAKKRVEDEAKRLNLMQRPTSEGDAEVTHEAAN